MTDRLILANVIDLNRCRRGMRQLSITGRARPELIEGAIRLIQHEPGSALQKQYLGIKNYASFGDQREDHDYGFGPKHGEIVFRIGRTDEAIRKCTRLDGDAVFAASVVETH